MSKKNIKKLPETIRGISSVSMLETGLNRLNRGDVLGMWEYLKENNLTQFFNKYYITQLFREWYQHDQQGTPDGLVLGRPYHACAYFALSSIEVFKKHQHKKDPYTSFCVFNSNRTYAVAATILSNMLRTVLKNDRKMMKAGTSIDEFVEDYKTDLLVGAGYLNVLAISNPHVTEGEGAVDWRVFTYSPGLLQMLQHTKLDNIPATYVSQKSNTAVEMCLPATTLPELQGKPTRGGRFNLCVERIIFRELSAEEGSELILYCKESKDTAPQPTRRAPVIFAGIPLPEIPDTADESERIKDYYPQALNAIVHVLKTRITGVTFKNVDSVGTSILNLMYATQLYVGMTDADIVLSHESPVYADWLQSLYKTKLEKRTLKIIENVQHMNTKETRRYHLGQTIKRLCRHESPPGTKVSTHASPVTHWRDGHFHHYWVNDIKAPTGKILIRKYVMPVLVNAPNKKSKKKAKRKRITKLH